MKYSLIFILFTLFNCSPPTEKPKFKTDPYFDSLASHRKQILMIAKNNMKKKGFQFWHKYKEDTECMKDADNYMEKMEKLKKKYKDYANIPSEIKTKYTDDSLKIDFKYLSACCSTKIADYTIKNNQLSIVCRNIDNLACDCMCLYEYHFSIYTKNKKLKLREISI